MDANDDTCIIDGCTKPIHVKARKMCRGHYNQAWKDGFEKAVSRGPEPNKKRCTIEGCPNKHKALGFCRRHLDRERAAGRLMTEELECAFEGCKRPKVADDLCLGHLRQKRKGRELTPLRSYIKRDGICPGPECEEPVKSGGYCSGHYWQVNEGRPLTPIVRESLKGGDCIVGGCTRIALTRDGLCRTHYRYRSEGREDWDKPIPSKAPNGAGHINADGYRIITVNGRNVGEHRHFAALKLGRPLHPHEEVHHVNGNRADNRMDGPFVMDERGRLRSGNLEVWSTSQPAGQEIGPKLDWGAEIWAEYAEYGNLDKLRRILAEHGTEDERERYGALGAR
jgi:hypothetical protein